LLEAHRALATLDGTGKHLPNPQLVLRPLQNREAQKSSSLEGTYTDPQQQILFELDPRIPASRDDPANAQREVFNYARALRLRRESEEHLPLSLRLIRQQHSVLMDGVRGGAKDPGEFRRIQNQVGRPARYVPPPVPELRELLDKFEKYLHGPHTYDPLVTAFLVHYQFEAIHPFLDGNGRVGRLLLAITIEEWCGLSNQWLYMSAYFDENKDDYIQWLFRGSTEGAWRGWIEFCLRGVVVQAHDTISRCERLIDLNRGFHAKVNEIGGSVRLSKIVDDLFITPMAWVSSTAAAHQVTYPTARSDLRKLEEAGVVNQIEDTYPIVYFCPQILRITYAD
jgi:Fic family protein